MPSTTGKSWGHKISNSIGDLKHPYKLSWKVKRQGMAPGFAVEMHRNSDEAGAQEFANRWGLKFTPNKK